MPLYEIVLRFSDRDEIRLADRNVYPTGEEVVSDGRRFVVTGSEPPTGPRADGRFVLEPSEGPSGRTSRRATSRPAAYRRSTPAASAMIAVRTATRKKDTVRDVAAATPPITPGATSPLA